MAGSETTFKDITVENLYPVTLRNGVIVRDGWTDELERLGYIVVRTDEIERLRARAERLRLELEKIGWMDEFLDADGARAMMGIARDAVNADENSVPADKEQR